LVNYRPEYSHKWNSKSYYTQLSLYPLGKESAAEILSALLGDGVEVTALKRVIIAKTGGNPFFIEELVEVLFDEVALVCEGGLVKIIRSPGREPRVPVSARRDAKLFTKCGAVLGSLMLQLSSL